MLVRLFYSYEIPFESISEKIRFIVTDNGSETRASRKAIGMKFNIKNSQCLLHKYHLIFQSAFDDIPVFQTVVDIVRFLRK